MDNGVGARQDSLPETTDERVEPDWASGWSWLAVGWMLLVAAVLFHFPPSAYLLVLVAAPVQILAWLLFAFFLARRLSRLAVARKYNAAVLGAFIGLGFMVINWSVWLPDLYFQTHRYVFTDLAQVFRNDGGAYDSGDAKLPFTSQIASADGTATAAEFDGDRIYLVPEFFNLVDGATGYVFVADHADPESVVDLEGDVALLGGGIDLGGGWWYLRPGDGGINQ